MSLACDRPGVTRTPVRALIRPAEPTQTGGLRRDGDRPVPRSAHDVATVPVSAPRPAADRHERQASRIAAPGGRLGPTVAGRGRAGERGTRRPPVRRTAAPDARLTAGRGLTQGEREEAESTLGMDLSGVRVHEGAGAAALAAEHGARALTYGSHVVLGRRAQASSAVRRASLAHELVHVGQQVGPARSSCSDGAPRGPPAADTVHLDPASVRVQCEAESGVLPGWLTEAAGAVATAGSGVIETATDLGGRAADLALDAGAAVVERLAPGLLGFLRGGAVGQVTELLCEGIGGVLGSSFSDVGEIDMMSAVESTFGELAGDVRDLHARLGGAASSAVGTVLGPLVRALQAWGGPLLQGIASATQAVDDLFTGFWDAFGAPVLDFLGQLGGGALQALTDLAAEVWELATPVRELASTAWEWLLEQFDLAWDSASGVRTWVEGLAIRAWDALRGAVEPVRGPLTTAAGVLVMLTPLGPVVLLTQVLPPLWEKVQWLWDNWNTADILVTAQDLLREDVIPALIGGVSGAVSALAGAGRWLADMATQVGTAMGGVLAAFGGNRCLQGLTGLLGHVANQFARLDAWAEAGFAGLVPAVSAVLDALVAMLQPVLDFLVRLALVVSNPFLLPVALAASVWMLCPSELKPPVIDFVLDLLIVAIGAVPAFLPGIGPLAGLIKAGVLGFLRQLRRLPPAEGTGEDRRVVASDKVAGLAAAGGVSFIAGFALGLLHGVLDGILDPFRLIFMLVQLLFAAAQAIGRVAGPLMTAVVPGLGAVVGAPAAGTAHGADPARHTAPSPSDAPLVPTAGPPEGEILAGTAGDLSDAELLAALPVRVVAQAADGSAVAAPAAEQLETEMRGEIRAEGATVAGLAVLLGDAWDAILAGAADLGARAAAAFLDFILLPDFELGQKIGFVAGFLLLQALVMYFSAGGFAAVKVAEPALRQLLIFLLRFLDLGGELFAVLGRALRPLRGPVLAGLGAARGFLSRFRFAAGLLERVEGIAGRLLGFADEAAGAAGRAGREGGERLAQEGAEASGRLSREAAQAGEGRIPSDAAQRSVRSADELGEGSLRTADDAAAPPRVHDQALEGRERAQALLEARAVEALHDDVLDSSLPQLMMSLALLRRRYRWIQRFEARRVGAGVFDIDLIASRTRVGRFSSGTEGPSGTGVPHGDEISRLLQDAERFGQSLSREVLEAAAREDPASFPRLAARVRQEIADRAAGRSPRAAQVHEEFTEAGRGGGSHLDEGLTTTDSAADDVLRRQRAREHRERRRQDIARPPLSTATRQVTGRHLRRFRSALRSDLRAAHDAAVGTTGSARRAAGTDYQTLVARDLGAEDVQEMFSREHRRMDVGTSHEVTLEGQFGGFSTNKLDQLWLDLRDNGQVMLTVPRLSDEAADQLARLAAQAADALQRPVLVIVRETAP